MICIGSGQVVFALVVPKLSPFTAAWDVCPECGRRVQVVTRDGVDVLSEHTAPNLTQPPAPKPASGPNFGL